VVLTIRANRRHPRPDPHPAAPGCAGLPTGTVGSSTGPHRRRLPAAAGAVRGVQCSGPL